MADANDNRSPRGSNDNSRTESQYVRAGSLEARNESVSSDGTETAVSLTALDDFGVDSSDNITDSNGWLLARDFIRLTVEVHADTGGNGNSCDFSVQGKVGANGQTVDIVADSTVSTDSISRIVENSSDLERYSHVRVLEHGTDGDTQEVRVVCK